MHDRRRSEALRQLPQPAGFANMPGSIDVRDTKIDVEKLPAALRAKIGTEKVVDDPGKKTRIKGPRKAPKVEAVK